MHNNLNGTKEQHLKLTVKFNLKNKIKRKTS